jgi:hypothetical protein
MLSSTWYTSPTLRPVVYGIPLASSGLEGFPAEAGSNPTPGSLWMQSFMDEASAWMARTPCHRTDLKRFVTI